MNPKKLKVSLTVALDKPDEERRQRIGALWEDYEPVQPLPNSDWLVDGYIYRAGLDALDPQRKGEQP